MDKPKVLIWHKCERGVLRNYPSVVCSLCRTPKGEDDHFVRVSEISALKKLVRALVEFVDDRVLDSIMDEFPILKAIIEEE